ncbi:MAG: hypothetical protein H6Q17_1226 [Bacteroidetes bacterium]|nr:hypothetical protein [Bacteroidota bacterium]
MNLVNNEKYNLNKMTQKRGFIPFFFVNQNLNEYNISFFFVCKSNR